MGGNGMDKGDLIPSLGTEISAKIHRFPFRLRLR
jgi:hypothetical protein